ncbi:MAG: hypothetical protein ACPW60_10405 [Methylohalobius sp. ZOD2]|nr:hypothetical protein [Methylothermaceae bacterium]
MFCKADQVKVTARDRLLTDQVYESPVDIHQSRFQTRLIWALLVLIAALIVLELID